MELIPGARWYATHRADPRLYALYRRHYSAAKNARWRRPGNTNCVAAGSPHRSSDLIREAEQLAWARWPGARLFTYVDGASVQSSNPGYCFKMAGWRRCGQSQSGLLLFEKQCGR